MAKSTNVGASVFKDGVVVAASQAAADAGGEVLGAGGSAIDAAVATALALAVVEPSQCGLGGYGGFLTYAPSGSPPVQVSFNTWIPERLDDSVLQLPGSSAPLIDGGRVVAPPAVVPGLVAAHHRFGRLPLNEVTAPAIRLARQGFPVGVELMNSLADHWIRTNGGSPDFAAIFFSRGRPPRVGELLIQADLAATLETLSDSSFRVGAIVDAICDTVSRDGGFLEPADFDADRVTVGPAASIKWSGGRLYGPAEPVSGTGILFQALAAVEGAHLGANRQAAYLNAVSTALGAAWNERLRVARGDPHAAHTTHLCVVDRTGAVASLTFTHGRRTFGSGLVASRTGVLLNAGVGLYARSRNGRAAVTNMTPIVIETEDGARHALGAVGGPRIPAIMLTAAVDVIHYGYTLAEAVAAPHLAVRPGDNMLEAEPPLLERAGAGTSWSTLKAGETFGPATGVTWTGDRAVAAPDPRFHTGVAAPDSQSTR